MNDKMDSTFQVSIDLHQQQDLAAALDKLGASVIPGETLWEDEQVYVWIEFDELHDARTLAGQIADLVGSDLPEIVCLHDEISSMSEFIAFEQMGEAYAAMGDHMPAMSL